MTAACDDIRIIDLSVGRKGGIATMVLADYGAEVIKVEPPGGHEDREDYSWPLFLRGKKSVTLDLAQEGDQAKLHDLVRGADVVVASYGPGEAAQYAADYETLSKVNPALVYCSVTAWGLRGPYAEYPSHDEALVAAKSGRLWAFQNVTKRPGPSFAAVQIGTHGASLAAVSGILAALHIRKRTGRGQFIETSILQGMLPFENNMVREQMEERYPQILRERGPQNTPTAMSSLGYQPIMCKDGEWIQFANLMEHLFQASIVSLGLVEEVLANPEYAGAPNGLPEDKREEVRNIMLNRALEKTRDEWMEIFYQNEDVAADYVQSAQDALYHRDLVANGEVVEYEHPKLGKLRMAGPISKLRDTPGVAGFPAVEPGANTDEVLNAPPREVPVGTGTGDRKPPLDGVIVLEFATIIATPLACTILGDLGARVIKVEPIGGDPGRGLARASGIGSYIGATRNNSTKESICIDLKSEHGQALLRELIKKADFIIHNYRPGVPERLGIGYEQVCQIKPDVIWMNLNGYGPDGPGYLHPGAHPIPGAVNGGALMQAGVEWPGDTSTLDGIREASRRFTRSNESNPDPCSAMGLQAAALIALHYRNRTGKGQQVFQSMVSANQYANSDDALSYEGKPDRPVLDAWAMGTGPLRRLYHAADEQWAFISAESDADFGKFCAAVGRNDLATDARFASKAARAENGDALTSELEPLFASKTADEWEESLIAAGVGCVRADTYPTSGQFWIRDPHVKANDLAPTARHLVMGEYQRWGPLCRFERNPGVYGGGQLAGEHTDQLLTELGFQGEQVQELRDRKVVWSDEPVYPYAR